MYAMDNVSLGGELMNYIYKKHILDEDETRKFMQQIVSAVDHLHRAGIIHRCAVTNTSGKLPEWNCVRLNLSKWY